MVLAGRSGEAKEERKGLWVLEEKRGKGGIMTYETRCFFGIYIL